MEDQAIVSLYFARSEEAVARTQEKYGRYLESIARNILPDREDCRESVNDAYLAAWNSIPPQRPEKLGTYLGKLTRRIAIDRFRRNNRAKRQPSEYALSLEELTEILPGGSDPARAWEGKELTRALEDFLRGLPERTRRVFLCRYYYFDPLERVAVQNGMTVPAVKSLLWRTRAALKTHLQKEGFDL